MTPQMRDAFNKAGYKNPNKSKGKDIEQDFKAPEIIFRKDSLRRRQLFTDDAKKWAGYLTGISDTQLRNFYNQVKALQAKMEANGFKQNDALIGLLKPKAAYALAKAENKKKKSFRFLQSMIEQCVDHCIAEEVSEDLLKEYFEDFALFFEAVLGFFKGGK